MSNNVFKDKLLALLGELGFFINEVMDNRLLSAHLVVGSVKIPFLIKYSAESASEITEDDVKLFFAELNLASSKIKGVKGLFVVSHFYTMDAEKSASELGLALATYEELLSSIVNFENYLHLHAESYEKSELYKGYVGSDIRDKSGEVIPGTTKMENWLSDDNNNLLFLLGQSGIGKTSFVSNLTYTLARSFLDEPTGIPIPVLINLKDYKNTFSLSNIIIYHLFNVHNLQLRSFNVFQHLLMEGRIVLILDGFDELIDDAQSYEAQLYIAELFSMATRKAKIILTSHPDYFLYNPYDTTEDTFYVSKSFERFKDKKNYTMATLLPFKEEHIKRYINEKTGVENKTLVNAVQKDKSFKEIAKYPVLLKLILETGIKKVKNKSEIFDLYISKWVEEDHWMSHFTKEGKIKFARELALTLWRKNAQSIHYTELPEYLSHYVKKDFKQKRDNDYLLIDIEATPFMLNTGGMTSFIHQAFTDYFVAGYIGDAMLKGEHYILQVRQLTRPVVEFLIEKLGVIKVFNFFKEMLETTSGVMEKSQAALVMFFVSEIVTEGGAFFTEEEYDLAAENFSLSGYDLKKVKLPYCNLSFANFENGSLAEAFLQNASLFSANLENADLSKSVLEKADLRKANLKNANLIDADLSFALLSGAKLKGAILVEASLIEVNLNNSYAEDAKFAQANLHAALGNSSNMKGANFNKAELQNADFCSSNFDEAVFNETNLNHALFIDSSFKGANISGCFIWGAELSGCDFKKARLYNLDMRNVKISYSKFEGTNISKADLEYADLRQALFKGTVFRDVNFANADVRDAVFEDCSFDKKSEESLKKAYGYVKQTGQVIKASPAVKKTRVKPKTSDKSDSVS
jgi:uncharacterized protein YjbI with pentapeptide repeats